MIKNDFKQVLANGHVAYDLAGLANTTATASQETDGKLNVFQRRCLASRIHPPVQRKTESHAPEHRQYDKPVPPNRPDRTDSKEVGEKTHSNKGVQHEG